MKRIEALLLLFLISLSSLFAFTDELKDFDTPEWLSFFKSAKENDSESTVESLYMEYKSSSPSNFEMARAENIYARYFMDNGDKERAKEHLKKQEEYYENLENDISETLSLIAEIDFLSTKYYINKDLGVGLENSNLTKKAKKHNPDEAFFIVTDAWRVIYTPKLFGGGLDKSDIKKLEELASSPDIMAVSNQYSLYGVLATAFYEKKDYDKSRKYLNLAFDFCYGEPTLLELDEKLKDKEK